MSELQTDPPCGRCGQPQSKHIPGPPTPPLTKGHLGATEDRPGICGRFTPYVNRESVERVFTTPPKPLRVRRLREQLNAVGEYVYQLRAPMKEGYRDAPAVIEGGLEEVEAILGGLDRHLAKLDGEKGAVGGAVVLREERREP